VLKKKEAIIERIRNKDEQLKEESIIEEEL
jgi:hypothetical protein